ncbi:pseudouridine synthase [Mycotypha africana]|uniref:pseudouridine synthase n=1 Tax=Mycotypha africana TaxID=64632 RepID=UPI0022FFC5D3|nr:pseudouridine synthase [Mycotypha africana]KAI8987352.1 pseudouridine synthase [Mycotypha africana]
MAKPFVLRSKQTLHLGLRKVKPYYFQFHCYARARMVGKTILKMFIDEFRGRTSNYYARAIENGLITVNGESVRPDRVIKQGDIIKHSVHRHEPPVPDIPVEIVFEDENLIVIDKPGCLHVHPAGRYRHNTVTHILCNERNIEKLYPSNRIDKITSGLLIMSKTPHAATKLGSLMKSREIEKEYICRVTGQFPGKQIFCEAPIKMLSNLVAYNYVHPEGKPCATIFDCLSYNKEDNTSLVRCRPLSGRTHQIRVHLRYMGYPIANDPIYSYSSIWSKQLELLDHKSVIEAIMQNQPYDYMDDDPLNYSGLPRCAECNIPLPNDNFLSNYSPLWLHAYKYSSRDWCFETRKLPFWAEDSFKADITLAAL